MPKGDFSGQHDLLNTQYPLNLESRFKLQNKTQDLRYATLHRNDKEINRNINS